MFADEFIELLGGARPSGPGRWSAHCPAHQDQHPSLSVAEGDDRVLLKCQTGCATGSILVELGLDWRDIFHDQPAPLAPVDAPDGYVYVGFRPRESGPGIPRHIGRRPELALELPSQEELDAWTAEVGTVSTPLLKRKGWTPTTLRRFEIGWDGKRLTIPVRNAARELVSLLRYRPGAADHKMLAPRGAGRFLFPPPESFRVPDLWLVEGEPDAISAFELELPAVGVPGVGTWKADWAERFIGRTVTICFDADGPGRTAAQARAADLRAMGVESRVVDLAPTKHNGYDLGEALVDAIRLERVPALRGYLSHLMQEAWT
jgi:hypothetical protein